MGGVAIALLTASALADPGGYYRQPGEFGEVRPDAVVFLPKTDVLLGGTVTSKPALFVGRDAAYSIRSPNATFRVCDDADCRGGGDLGWVSSGTVSGGRWIQMRTPGPTEPGQIVGAVLDVQGSISLFDVYARSEAPAIGRPDAVEVEPFAIATSSLVDFRGWVETELSVRDGEVSVCAASGACTDFGPGPLDVRDGDQIRLRAVAGDFDETRTVVAQAGGATVSWDVRTRTRVVTPDIFVLGPDGSEGDHSIGIDPVSSLVDPFVDVVSSPATLEGFDRGRIAVVGGEYSIDGGPFVVDPGTVYLGSVVRVRVRSGDFGETRTANLSIGAQTVPFTVVTRDRRTSPSAFSIDPATGVEPGATVVSSPVLPRDHDGLVVSVAGGEYQVCASADCSGATWTSSTTSLVPPGSSIRIRGRAGSFSERSAVTLTAGGISSRFDISVRDRDVDPDAFSIAATDGSYDPGQVVLAGISELSGFDDGPISVTGSGVSYSIGGAAFSSAPGRVRPGDRVVLRIVAGDFSEKRTVGVSIGGRTAATTVATRMRDEDPDAFALGDVGPLDPGGIGTSAPITLVGFDDGPVTIVGGEYSISSGPWTASEGRIRPGQDIRVRATAGPFGRIRTARLTVGSTFSDLSVSTRPRNETPKGFGFVDAVDVEPGASVETFSTVSGFDAAPYAVTSQSGTASIRSGAWSKSPGEAAAGDRIGLRAVAGGFSETVRVTATLGTVSATWSATTRNRDVDPGPWSFPAGPTTAVPGSIVVSSSVVPSGYDDGPVSITGGEYSIAGGPWASAPGRISSGQSIAVRLVAGAFEETRSLVATIGSTSASWSVRSRAGSCTTPWGTRVVDGGSTTAYASSSVGYGSSCQAQTRTCSAGVLSGGYSNASCQVASPASCSTGQWGRISHGSSVTAYASSSVSYGGRCQSQTRTCNDGSLSGSYSQTSCSVQAPASCTAPWGGTVPHGSSVTAYAAANVGYGGSCQGQTRTCSNGSLSGSFGASSCSVAACVPNRGAYCEYNTSWSGMSHGCGGSNCTGGSIARGRELSCRYNGDGTTTVSCNADIRGTVQCNGSCS